MSERARRLPWRRVVLVAAVAAVLAVGAFLLIRWLRVRAFVDDAVERTRSALELAQQNLPADPGPARISRLIDDLAGRGFETVVRSPAGEVLSSRLDLSLDAVPQDLQQLVRDGLLAYQPGEALGGPHLVVGGRVDRTELYLLFPEEDLRRGIAELALLLGAGWLGVTLLIGLALAGLQARVAVLSAARARERRFTADVAHELRTPLAALVGEASLLREQLERMPEDARRPAELLVRDVARLRRLVEDLMEISSLDAGGEVLELGPVDLVALVDAVLQARGWAGRVAVERRGGPPVQTDRRRLERVVANLVGNALEHGGDGPVRVIVRRELRAGGATLEVADGGPGIPPEALAHLFDRFYKADRSRTGPGSGLGLAIARENARLLGGDIAVQSEPGEGARFTLRLPEHPPAAS